MSKQIRVFWMGFAFTAALTVWVYWIWRHERVVVPKPLVVSQSGPGRTTRFERRPTKRKETAAMPDALEEIRGIGPVIANRLNDAGIFTFSQLAGASPDDIARITGVTRWDPADWIAEAAALAAAQA